MATTAETLRRTNENPGTRAILRNCELSPFKVRAVLDLIRNQDVQTAMERLQFCERAPAIPVAKLLNSAIANAENNDNLAREDLFVTTAFCDEGTTAKRWRPRARGRAGRIRKRSSHITIVVARLPEDRLEVVRTKQAESNTSRRRRVSSSRSDRVAGGKKADEVTEETTSDAVNDEAVEEVEPTNVPGDVENTTESSETIEDTATDADAKEEGK